jgi:glucosamine-6-phosphate deaminase
MDSKPQTVPLTRISCKVFEDGHAAARFLAAHIRELVQANNSAHRATVLGLPTGSTPVNLYRELIRLHKEECLDFSRVVTFNLDEYHPMPKNDPHSYNLWMHETFFNHVNIPAANIHIPSGTIPAEQAEQYCRDYEAAIKSHGGIDLLVLGIGRTGHIGFNEPGSSKESRTRMVTLDPVTRRDAASGFFGEHNGPHSAISMGVGTILECRQVFLLAFGEHKARIVHRAAEMGQTEAVTASFLQSHPRATFLLDADAASELTARACPWRGGPIEWTPQLIRKAVIQLALEKKKALLKLSDDDFREHGLYDLLREMGPASKLGQRVFSELSQTITDNPGGEKPGTAIVFSPHPDDDVISMGGTIIRLVEKGHKVHIAYMTSGNIAVFDHDAWRFTDFVDEFSRLFGIESEKIEKVRERVQQFLKAKKPGESDSPDLLKIKSLIRTTEARAGAAVCGVPPEQLEFMDLRFYRTGTIAKAPIHPHDVDDIAALFRKLNPTQIYVAGEMSDPHGTHRTCAEAIFMAVRRVFAQGMNFQVWLYRGAWEEWQPHEIERVVPLSPEEILQKREAIFRHQSQKDRAMFPGGSDKREFWQRAEDRNKQTAKTFDQLGLPEYYALEGLVQWRGA